MTARSSLNTLVQELDSVDYSGELASIARVINGMYDTKDKIKHRIAELEQLVCDSKNLDDLEYAKISSAITQLQDVLKWLPKN